VPVTSGPAQQAAGKVLSCILSEPTMVEWSKAHAYIPSKTAAAEKFGKDQPAMQAFVDEVGTARSRTAELGEKYPKVSQALADALQAALTVKTPVDQALKAAQQASGS
jgi:multiple sugar transport system substrate-binding protein